MFEGVGVLVPKLEDLNLSENQLDSDGYDSHGDAESISEELRLKRKSVFGKLVRAFAGCRSLKSLDLTLEGVPYCMYACSAQVNYLPIQLLTNCIRNDFLFSMSGTSTRLR